MAAKRKRRTVSGAIAALMGVLCALLLCLLFYGAMVYQLAGEEAPTQAEQSGATAGALALTTGTLEGETTALESVGGADCTVTRRTYRLPDGTQARAITASPAAYIERLSAPGVQMQLITGFVIDDLDAVYALSGDMGILAAREGDTVYMIEGPGDQQAMYELGALAGR